MLNLILFVPLLFLSRWNAARALAGFLQRNSDLYLGRSVLELGAGGGLPGLVTAKCGARKVLACLLAMRRKRLLFWPPLTVYCLL